MLLETDMLFGASVTILGYPIELNSPTVYI
jgi:hypothetical protein